jgi:hypothetical protein
VFDVLIDYILPVGPIGESDSQDIGYYLNPADWNNTLQFRIQFGDATSLGTPAGTTTTAFSAYGSESGSPQLDIMLVYGNLGPLRNSISFALITRNFQTITAPMQSAGVQIRIALLQNQKTMNVIFKRGTLAAGTSSAVTVFGTLSDFITDQTILRVDNKPIRNMQYDDTTKEWYGWRFQNGLPQGYLDLSFDDGMQGAGGANSLAHFPGDRLAGGAQFELVSNIVAPASANFAEVIQEQQYGDVVTAGG